MEEELARIVGDRETVENENKMLRRRVSSLESQLVRNSLIPPSARQGGLTENPVQEDSQHRIEELSHRRPRDSQEYDDRGERLQFRVNELQDEVQKLEDKIFDKEEEISSKDHKIARQERIVSTRPP